jgi:hypothetical protein
MLFKLGLKTKQKYVHNTTLPVVLHLDFHQPAVWSSSRRDLEKSQEVCRKHVGRILCEKLAGTDTPTKAKREVRFGLRVGTEEAFGTERGRVVVDRWTMSDTPVASSAVGKDY